MAKTLLALLDASWRANSKPIPRDVLRNYNVDVSFVVFEKGWKLVLTLLQAKWAFPRQVMRAEARVTRLLGPSYTVHVRGHSEELEQCHVHHT